MHKPVHLISLLANRWQPSRRKGLLDLSSPPDPARGKYGILVLSSQTTSYISYLAAFPSQLRIFVQLKTDPHQSQVFPRLLQA